MTENFTQTLEVGRDLAGQRIDHVLATMFPDYSRSRLQKWLKLGQILVNGQVWSAKDKVAGGEVITCTISPLEEVTAEAEAVPLNIVYQDEALIVLNKPAGLVVHPAAGNWHGTVLNGLLYHFPELEGVPRAGIVHRLDKDTSGLMVVARTIAAQTALVDQLQSKTVNREYRAIVYGCPVAGGTVDAPIGRHARDRKRQAVVDRGKPAITHYRIAARFRHHTSLKVFLETGRTHQIRVHMAHIGFPIVGDPVYGGRLRIPGNTSEALEQALRGFHRQALHAIALGLTHPVSGDSCYWECDLAADMAELTRALEQDAALQLPR